LRSKQQHPGANAVHQITGWQLDFWIATERTFCHVSRSGSQVELSPVLQFTLHCMLNQYTVF